MSTQPDYLFEDPSVPNQKYVCLSILTPKNFKEPTSMYTLKVRGCYDTEEEARKRANYLRNIDPNIDVLVGDVGKWLPFDNDPEKAKEQDYENKRLNDMMKGYLDNQEKAKEFHEQRKNEMILRSMKENEEKEKRRKNREERRLNGEVVDDDAEETAFYKQRNNEEEVSNEVSGTSSTNGAPLEENNNKIDNVKSINTNINQTNVLPSVQKEKMLKEKEKEMKEKEKDMKEEKENLSKTQEEYNKYQQKTEKIRSELEEAKKIYEAMLAAGMKGKSN